MTVSPSHSHLAIRAAARARALLATAALLLMSACGTAAGSGGPAASPSPPTAGPTPRPTATAVPSEPPSPSATAVATSPAASSPKAAGPSATARATGPAGFAVGEVSAVSLTRWWVLGTDAAGSPALASTADGGLTWNVPVLPAALGADTPATGGEPAQPGIAMSDADHGVLTVDGTAWVTADGGLDWSAAGPAAGPVVAVAATPTASLALVRTASGFALDRAAAGTGELRTVLGPDRLTTTEPALAASGTTVVVVSGNRRLLSTDGGSTFSALAGPCTADLGGRVTAAGSAVVVWCATGMDGSAWVSTDRGRHVRALPGAAGANSTAAAPTGSGGTLAWADESTGVHVGTGAATDAVTGRAMHHVSWLGFATAVAGFAVAAASDTGPDLLWHTADGGRTWTPVAIS